MSQFKKYGSVRLSHSAVLVSYMQNVYAARLYKPLIYFNTLLIVPTPIVAAVG